MIQIENFKAGTYRKACQYRSFVPTLVNQPWSWHSPELSELIERAAHQLGELNAFSRFVPSTDLFIQLHVTREAVISSRIEGTRTNMEEAFLPESEINPERRNDWQEVTNHIKGMNEAILDLQTLPLSGRLIRKTHRMLLHGARGQHKLPGEYRNSQNWIGGASLADATFVPPHHDMVPDLMSDLEHYLHNGDLHLPELLRIAVAHYQFETIHPFLDGNGRIGRLLITLYLVYRKLLDKPLLYLSAFFESDRNLYYDNLNRVRTHDDMKQWLKYFFVGVEQTARQAVTKLQLVLQLKENTESFVRQHFGKRKESALVLLHALLQNPVTTVELTANTVGLSYKAANNLVLQMQRAGIVREITGQSRNRIFIFDNYLKAFEV